MGSFAEKKWQLRRVRVLGGVLLSILLGLGLVIAGGTIAAAIPITIEDDAGPDDEPGQKDLNELTVDFAPAGSDLEVTWNWDVISVSGQNTGDACALFDTDNDGNANYSLCVVWDNGASYQTTILYSCGDGRADRCDQPVDVLAEDTDGDGDLEALVGGPYGSTCSLATVPDTFGTRAMAQADTDLDTQASCVVELDDFGGMDAFLLNVCSYPSGEPNSDPSDCVLAPDSGFLTIVKVADPNDGTTFTFDLGAGQAANNGDTSFSIDGSGSVDLIGFPAGTDFDLTEVVPAGWQLDTAACELSDGTATGTFGGDTISDFEIQVGRETTCTFNDSKLAELTLVKEITNDNGGTAVESDWTLTADGTAANDLSGQGPSVNGFVQADTFTLSETDVAGYTLTSLTCDGGTLVGDQLTLAAGDDVTCVFVNDDDAASLILAKDVINDNGGTAIESDWTLSAGSNNVTGSPAGLEATNQAGTYSLSETGPTGYTLTSLTCDNNPGVEITDVTIGLGETITCVFVNDDDAASLILAKDVINDNGGTAIESDWTLSAGSNNVTGSPAGLEATNQAGTYSLSETGPTGYTLTSLTCDNNPGVEITDVTIGLGETITCVFVNDDDAASLILAKDVINDNGGTAIESDWTLSAGSNNVTGSPAGLEATNQAGTYSLSETGPTGYTLTSLTCDNNPGVEITDVTIGLGETITCVFVNDDDEPSLTLVKVVDNGANPGGTATEADFTLTATGPTGFDGPGPSVSNGASFDAGIYDLSESGPSGYLASDWDCVGGSQTDGDTVAVGLGEDVTCTITNTAMGMTTLLKLTNGAENQTMNWNFTLTGPGVDESDSSPPTTVDFGGVKLIPGEEYTLCEVGIPAGWTLEWQVDTNGDGIPDTIIPQVSGTNTSPVGPDGYSQVYDPNFVPPPGQFTNDTRCVNFVVGVGETLAFQINNSMPGGEPRTIGFWKNWNSCTGGNQPATAAANGGAAAGWFILDDLLNNPGYTIGALQLDGADCEDAVNILDKRSIDDGKKRASDGAYNLASQLLAAQLNLSAGAETCQEVVDAVNAAQTLLAGIGFDGTGNYLKGKQAGDANELAAILDAYNNGLLCN